MTWLRSFFIALLLFALPGTAISEPRLPSELSRLVAAGDYETARALLRKAFGNSPETALHLAHLEGLIALRQGDGARAERIFREVLAAEPRFDPSRRELTALLLARGDRQAASYQAKQLLPSSRSEEERELIERLVLVGQGGKRWGIVPKLFFSPSNNLNRGPVDTDAGAGFQVAGPKSGMGVTFGLSVWHNMLLSENWRGTLTFGVDRKLYSADILPHETTASLRFDIGRLWPNQQLSIGLKADKLFRGQDEKGENEERLTYGIDGRFQRKISERVSGSLAFGFLRQDFKVQEGRDGHRIDVTAKLDFHISENSRLSVGLPIQIENTAAAHLAHRDLGLSLGYSTRLANGLALSAEVEVQRSDYQGNFPGRPYARKDVVKSLSLSASHPAISIRGLVPSFGVVFQQTQSNISFLTNDSVDFQLSLSKSF